MKYFNSISRSNTAKYALIVFTRYPEPGQTKTRLIPALGAQSAAQLQRAMTENTLETGYVPLKSAACNHRNPFFWCD